MVRAGRAVGDEVAPAHPSAGFVARPIRRWISGIRNRSQATRAARPGRARIREPRRSAQGPARRRSVSPPAREVDQLDVEDDARDPLPAEQVVGGRAAEALESALGVLDRADDPQRRQHMEGLAEQAPVARLTLPHVRAIGLDPLPSATSGSPSAATSGSSRSGGVAMSASAKTTRSVDRGEHPSPNRGALAAMGDGTGPESRRPPARRPPAGPDHSAVPSVLPSSTTRTSIAQAAPPPRALPRGRAAATRGSRTARRARARSAPPRCRRAARSSGVGDGSIAGSLGRGSRGQGR